MNIINLEFTDEKKIEGRIKNRVDIFDRDYKYEKVDLDDVFPKYILDNLNKYQGLDNLKVQISMVRPEGLEPSTF